MASRVPLNRSSAGTSERAVPQTAPGTIEASLNYLARGDVAPQVRIYPPSSGLPTVYTQLAKHLVTIRDARPEAQSLRLDEHGFELRGGRTDFTNFFDEAAVRATYYPDVQQRVEWLLGAHAVVAFDHNVRSVTRAARGEKGVRAPADQVHNDYTERSGPRRKLDVLAAVGRSDLADRHFAFVNLWRPIVGPVYDQPLAVCDSRSVAPSDLVNTEILHFMEDDLAEPRHRGDVHSVLYSPSHRWYYVQAMQPEEFLLLKCFDSRLDGRARFTPHSAFENPACPREFVARESIEVRTLVVFDEA
jgi:hypothetical protein